MTSDNLTIPRRIRASRPTSCRTELPDRKPNGMDGVTLSAKELAALVRYPMTLSEDAIINLADKLAYEIGYAFALKEDQCGFIGDGTSTYSGIRGLATLIDDANHGNSITTNGTVNGGEVVAAAGGTSFGSTVLGDYERMVGVLPQYAAMEAKWYFSRAGFAAGPQRLMDAGGGNTNETLGSRWRWQPHQSGQVRPSLADVPWLSGGHRAGAQQHAFSAGVCGRRGFLGRPETGFGLWRAARHRD